MPATAKIALLRQQKHGTARRAPCQQNLPVPSSSFRTMLAFALAGVYWTTGGLPFVCSRSSASNASARIASAELSLSCDLCSPAVSKAAQELCCTCGPQARRSAPSSASQARVKQRPAPEEKLVDANAESRSSRWRRVTEHVCTLARYLRTSSLAPHRQEQAVTSGRRAQVLALPA